MALMHFNNSWRNERLDTDNKKTVCLEQRKVWSRQKKFVDVLTKLLLLEPKFGWDNTNSFLAG